MEENNVQIRFSAVRHPQSNPCERFMKEISKFCRIYCHQNHKKWVELIPHIEVCLNTTVASTTWYTPVELMFEAKRPNLFEEILPEITGGETDQEEIQDKIANAYERIKEKINKRKKRRRRGNPNWKPSLHEKVLLKIQTY
jgi:tRNA(Ser,Leu) C12 N-acetylase TAN1